MVFALYFATLAVAGAVLGALLGLIGSPSFDLPAVLGAVVLLGGAAAMVGALAGRR